MGKISDDVFRPSVIVDSERGNLKISVKFYIGVCRVPIFCRVPNAEYYDCEVPSPSSEPSIYMF